MEVGRPLRKAERRQKILVINFQISHSFYRICFLFVHLHSAIALRLQLFCLKPPRAEGTPFLTFHRGAGLAPYGPEATFRIQPLKGLLPDLSPQPVNPGPKSFLGFGRDFKNRHARMDLMNKIDGFLLVIIQIGQQIDLVQ